MTTTLHAIPAATFFELKERRHLRRLADVLLGKKAPATLDIAGPHATSELRLPQDAWPSLAPQLAAFEPIHQNQYARSLTDGHAETFTHGALRPAFWSPRAVLLVLSAFGHLLFDVKVEQARARGDAAPGETAAQPDGITRVRLDAPKLVEAGLLAPRMLDIRTVIAPASLAPALDVVEAWAEERRPGAFAPLRADLEPVLRFFTAAFVGDWAEGQPWSRLGGAVVVRLSVPDDDASAPAP